MTKEDNYVKEKHRSRLVLFWKALKWSSTFQAWVGESRQSGVERSAKYCICAIWWRASDTGGGGLHRKSLRATPGQTARFQQSHIAKSLIHSENVVSNALWMCITHAHKQALFFSSLPRLHARLPSGDTCASMTDGSVQRQRAAVDY